MKFIIYTALLFLLSGCNEREPDPIFDWGYLPNLADNYGENREICAHKYYSLGFFTTSEVQQTLHIKGERVSGRSHSTNLGKTCLKASIATRVYMSPELQTKNYYSLSVYVPTADDRCLVAKPPLACKDSSFAYTTIFQRDIDARSIGDFFKGKVIDDIVDYNPKNKKLKFNLRNEVIEFQVPNL